MSGFLPKYAMIQMHEDEVFCCACQAGPTVLLLINMAKYSGVWELRGEACPLLYLLYVFEF